MGKGVSWFYGLSTGGRAGMVKTLNDWLRIHEFRTTCIVVANSSLFVQ